MKSCSISLINVKCKFRQMQHEKKVENDERDWCKPTEYFSHTWMGFNANRFVANFDKHSRADFLVLHDSTPFSSIVFATNWLQNLKIMQESINFEFGPELRATIFVADAVRYVQISFVGSKYQSMVFLSFKIKSKFESWQILELFWI